MSHYFSANEIVRILMAIAFLVMLEKLSSVERAVFLLREVFEYDYDEIGKIVEKNPTNCRQIVRRAKQHLGNNHSRFNTTLQQQERLTRNFMAACDRGDLPGLIQLFENGIQNVMTVKFSDRQIHSIYVVRNPEKLRRISDIKSA